MKTGTQVYHDKVVHDLKNFISANIDKQYTLNQLGQKAAISAFHLSRVFKQAEGISLKKYIHNKRIEKSLQEVLYTNRKLKDISFTCGFEEYTSFCRGFKRIYKISPDDLRKIILVIKKKNNIAPDAAICIKPSTAANVQSDINSLRHGTGVFIVQKNTRNNKKEFSVHPHRVQ